MNLRSARLISLPPKSQTYPHTLEQDKGVGASGGTMKIVKTRVFATWLRCHLPNCPSASSSQGAISLKPRGPIAVLQIWEEQLWEEIAKERHETREKERGCIHQQIDLEGGKCNSTTGLKAHRLLPSNNLTYLLKEEVSPRNYQQNAKLENRARRHSCLSPGANPRRRDWRLRHSAGFPGFRLPWVFSMLPAQPLVKES